jgi:hypothetical protein
MKGFDTSWLWGLRWIKLEERELVEILRDLVRKMYLKRRLCEQNTCTKLCQIYVQWRNFVLLF